MCERQDPIASHCSGINTAGRMAARRSTAAAPAFRDFPVISRDFEEALCRSLSYQSEKSLLKAVSFHLTLLTISFQECSHPVRAAATDTPEGRSFLGCLPVPSAPWSPWGWGLLCCDGITVRWTQLEISYFKGNIRCHVVHLFPRLCRHHHHLAPNVFVAPKGSLEPMRLSLPTPPASSLWGHPPVGGHFYNCVFWLVF